MNSIKDFVQRILSQALAENATDIHFEPFDKFLEIRYRRDGGLVRLPSFPLQIMAPLVIYLKMLANLNAYNSLKPQDGRLTCDLGDKQIDFRISCLPTGFGESIVLRVLNQTNFKGSLKELSIRDVLASQLKRIIRLPNGLLVVTGPTGAGKTTTLYTLLREMDLIKKKIVTVEDPVEYPLEHITQVPIHTELGLTFPVALKRLLRHDPDILMIGEIRDAATAQIAVQAALTGHLVLTTLHSKDVASAIVRLLDLKVEAFLLASALKGILAQRLVRKTCLDCAIQYDPNPYFLEHIAKRFSNEQAQEIQAQPLLKGKGCSKCQGSGFYGRVGIFQFVPIIEGIRENISGRLALQGMEKLLMSCNMPLLEHSALLSVIANETTFEEIAHFL